MIAEALDIIFVLTKFLLPGKFCLQRLEEFPYLFLDVLNDLLFHFNLIGKAKNFFMP